jgi:hypothetical protein
MFESNVEAQIGDFALRRCIQKGPYMHSIGVRISRVDFAPDFKTYVDNLPPLAEGEEAISFLDFDGVVVESSLMKYLGQILLNKGDFNHVSEEAATAIGSLKSQGPVIITTNRTERFNRDLEKHGATPEEEIVEKLGIPTFLDALDRQHPLRDHDNELLDKIGKMVSENGFSANAKRRILRLVFDINDGFTTWFSTITNEIGMPLELNS